MKTKVVLRTLCTLLTLLPLMSIAEDHHGNQKQENILCVAGLKQEKQTSVLELNPENCVQGTLNCDPHQHAHRWVGALPTSHGTVLFEVEATDADYHYKASLRETSEIFIDERVLELPALRSKSFPAEGGAKDGEVYIQCVPYNSADYCRVHTC